VNTITKQGNTESTLKTTFFLLLQVQINTLEWVY